MHTILLTSSPVVVVQVEGSFLGAQHVYWSPEKKTKLLTMYQMVLQRDLSRISSRFQTTVSRFKICLRYERPLLRHRWFHYSRRNKFFLCVAEASFATVIFNHSFQERTVFLQPKTVCGCVKFLLNLQDCSYRDKNIREPTFSIMSKKSWHLWESHIWHKSISICTAAFRTVTSWSSDMWFKYGSTAASNSSS